MFRYDTFRNGNFLVKRNVFVEWIGVARAREFGVKTPSKRRKLTSWYEGLLYTKGVAYDT
ncbi:hypothetical protein LCGC14_2773730, partial [marine sediment metagenome]